MSAAGGEGGDCVIDKPTVSQGGVVGTLQKEMCRVSKKKKKYINKGADMPWKSDF